MNYRTKAMGKYSLATGHVTETTGTAALALGSLNNAQGRKGKIDFDGSGTYILWICGLRFWPGSAANLLLMQQIA